MLCFYVYIYHRIFENMLSFILFCHLILMLFWVILWYHFSDWEMLNQEVNRLDDWPVDFLCPQRAWHFGKWFDVHPIGQKWKGPFMKHQTFFFNPPGVDPHLPWLFADTVTQINGLGRTIGRQERENGNASHSPASPVKAPVASRSTCCVTGVRCTSHGTKNNSHRLFGRTQWVHVFMRLSGFLTDSWHFKFKLYMKCFHSSSSLGGFTPQTDQRLLSNGCQFYPQSCFLLASILGLHSCFHSSSVFEFTIY